MCNLKLYNLDSDKISLVPIMCYCDRAIKVNRWKELIQNGGKVDEIIDILEWNSTGKREKAKVLKEADSEDCSLLIVDLLEISGVEIDKALL